MDRVFGYPLFACLDVTYKCNLKCIHCCFADEAKTANDNASEELSTTQIKTILDELNDNKIFSFQLAGGEPFCREDIFELIQYTSKLSFVTSIATNGLFINNEVAKFLKQSKIGHVQISLDGSTQILHEFVRGTNTFDKTLGAIQSLVDNNVSTSIAYTLSKNNIEDIDGIIDLVNQYSVRNIRFQVLVKQGGADKNFADLEIDSKDIKGIFDVINDNEWVKSGVVRVTMPCTMQFLNRQKTSFLGGVGCGAGTTNVNINPYGDVTACAMFTTSDWSLGNIKTQSLREIWSNSQIQKWRDCDNIGGKCAECDLLEVCKGGCRANAYLYSNDFFAQDPLCWR